MPKSYLIDMDGVIVRGSELIPGANAFLDRLHAARDQVSDLDQQSAVHAARFAASPAAHRRQRHGRSHLHLGAGHGAVPEEAACPMARRSSSGKAA